MPDLPEIKVKPILLDKIINLMALLIIISLWILTFIHYPKLPESIPTHFNETGVADEFGSKSSIFILPLIASFLYAGLAYLSKVPHLFSYPTKIITENTEKQYRFAGRVLRYINLIICLSFAYILWKTINTAEPGLGKWFLPVFMGFILLPLVIYIAKNQRE